VAATALKLKVIPDTQQEAEEYYAAIVRNMPAFPRRTLPESSIADLRDKMIRLVGQLR
jgi:hypothetical protein